MAKKSLNPKASNFERLSNRDVNETLKHRDVFEDQQLDRSQIEKVRTMTVRTTASVIAGVLLAILTWVLLSGIGMGIERIAPMFSGGSAGVSSSQHYQSRLMEGSSWQREYCSLDQAGAIVGPCYESEEEAAANPPQWVLDERAAAEAEAAADGSDTPAGERGYVEHLLTFTWWKAVITLLVGLGTVGLLRPYLMRNLDAQNLMNDTTDINQYAGDQHIALPEEVMRKFDWFPDVGAHSSVQVSSMISHVMLTNKGLKRIDTSKRAEKDILDEDGDIEYLKGEILRADDGSALTRSEPLIDEAFGDSLFDASGMPKDKRLRKKYDTTTIPYNADGSDREKLGKFKTVADLINEDWTYPEFEVQRPGGAYLVDTAPVNTMVLAITRAGKGQTYIEPVLDMWLRERRPNNMVVNDPKGELLVKNYVRATMRGFQVVQFNLINAMKTDIYNPLGMAADAAREGDSMKCAQYVENIADVFFPTDGGEDPVWPNAANNAFKRAAYGLIDFYLEEERALRATAARTGMDPKVLETRLDAMWGKVTLYNCYQLFVQLTAKKLKNPVKELDARAKAGEFGNPQNIDEFREDEYLALRDEAMAKSFLWEDKDELDMLTLFFNATQGLPRNSMRDLVANADNALRAMGAAEKMLASVYGVAITAMSFFTDPTISTLTSGTPSQNTDLGGLSFPRRMGVRFAANYVKRDHLAGLQARWDAFEDARFEKPLGKDFDHDDTVSREGWARYYFQGKFQNDVAYLRLRLLNPQTGMLIRTFHFRFTKAYQTSLNGRYFITDPITGAKIVKNGIIVELKQREDGSYAPGNTTYPNAQLVNLDAAQPEVEKVQAPAIITNMVRYSEAPKAVFLVTPPHLMKYAKLILILVKQLVDLNFDKSYMTKSSQKPLYKTRFMLDELGNLQSEGHGISGLETMLSIGLGQEQQFTLILQTLQQLRDVYGESVDKIVQGNVSNIIFLKSTDDSMIETLSKMSGTRHVAYRDSKTVTKDTERLIKGLNVEGKVSYTMTTKEEPVIAYNDMAFISERNSIVFRAGDSPVWNRNETILPMSWRLFKDTIVHPGHEYTLQTIPTLSTAMDFDVRMNQPDFLGMLDKRMKQAEVAVEKAEVYRIAFDYSEADVARLDPDVYSDEVMALVDQVVREEMADELGGDASDMDAAMDAAPADFYRFESFDDNMEMMEAQREAEAVQADRDLKRYAGGTISRSMLVRNDGRGKEHALDKEIVEVYKRIPALLHAAKEFSTGVGGVLLASADGSTTYIEKVDESEFLSRLQEASRDGDSTVYDEESGDASAERSSTYVVHPEFYEFLASLDSWQGIADGAFEKNMRQVMREVEDVSIMDQAA